jgi:hypothetical protein
MRCSNHIQGIHCCDPENIHGFSQGSSAGALDVFNNKYNKKS